MAALSAVATRPSAGRRSRLPAGWTAVRDEATPSQGNSRVDSSTPNNVTLFWPRCASNAGADAEPDGPGCVTMTLSTRLTARGPPVSRSATSHTSHPTSPPHGPPPLADSHSALLEHSPPWYNLCEGFAGMQSLE